MPSSVDSLLEQFGASTLDEYFGVEVTYQRRSTETSSITATWESVEYTIVDSKGFEAKVQSRDYIIAAAVLVLDGEAVEPSAGDYIKETIGGTVRTFEAMRFGNLPVWELMPGGYRYRIRTRQVDE